VENVMRNEKYYKYYGIFVQSKNWRARETTTARQQLCNKQQYQSHHNGVTVGRGVLYVSHSSSDEGMPYHQMHNCLTVT
jgi:uncharacterized membrane protein